MKENAKPNMFYTASVHAGARRFQLGEAFEVDLITYKTARFFGRTRYGYEVKRLCVIEGRLSLIDKVVECEFGFKSHQAAREACLKKFNNYQVIDPPLFVFAIVE